METSADYTYNDILNDERYKKLERHLKKIVMRNSEIPDQRKIDTPDYDMCLSSIHGDQMDTSYAGSSSISHKLGSEVIASSSNIKNFQQKRLKNNYPSSLKTTVINQIEPSECELMPPPKSVNVLAHSSRKNSPVKSKNTISSNVNIIPQNTINVSPKKPTLPPQIEMKKPHVKNHNKSINNLEPDRIFTKWKVILNDQGQLVIKGTLECGKIAKSKPVLQRLTSNIVKSIFKNIYLLKGIIYDEKNELPEFIRGKFYNGFPDDWENVHQLWKNYNASRHLNRTFRWPTPVSDTDDDITSEITDVTEYQSAVFNNDNNKKYNDDDDDKNVTAESIIETSETIKQTSLQNDNKPMNQSKCCCCCSAKSVSPHDTSSPMNIKKNDHNNTIDNFMETLKDVNRKNSPKKSNTCLTDIIREDGLTKILENLSRENYSIEYIDKIIQMFDALKFFVSHQQSDDNGAKQNQHDDKTKQLENIKNSSFVDNDDDSKLYCIIKKSVDKQKNHYESSDSTKDSSSDDNRKDKQLNKYLQSRKLSRRVRYSMRKNIHNIQSNRNKLYHLSHQGKFIQQKKLTKDSSFTESYKNFTKSQEKKSSRYIDTDVSITEDEKKSQGDYNNSYEENRFINKQKSSSINMVKNQSSKIHYLNTCGNKNNNSSSSFIDQEFEKVCHQNNIDEIHSHSHDSNQKNIKTKQIVERHMENIKSIENNSSEMINQQKLVDKIPVILDNDKENCLKNNFSHQKKGSEEIKNMKKPAIVDVQDSPMNLKILTTKNLPVNINDKIILNKTTKNLIIAKENNNPKIQETTVKNNKDNINLSNNENKKFGSQLNPKKLNNWIPKLQKKNDGTYGLIFEGKLLNEVNHIVNRKFTTELLYKRINRILIVTIDNNYYELVGEFNNTKHQIPKSIQKYFLRGCPRIVSKICEKWITEQQITNDTNIDIKNPPKSSSGRIIYPQLSYWQGQKLSVIDNKPVYSPGHSQESSFDNSKKDNSQNSTKSRDTSSKDSSFPGQNNNDKIMKKKLSESKDKIIDTNIELNEPRRVTRLMKRRRVHDAKTKNADTSEDDETVDRKKKKISTRQMENKSVEVQKNVDVTEPIILNQSKNFNDIKITYSYKKNVPYNNDLSDDETSIINYKQKA
ncbi:hypothetical protein HCN44_000187 [Aphidius gifuensis]|uniref:SANTA domain-containing protein n=1 Tax=Aphidius gifuensis TaxID=684658 RepID=A0A834XRJ9_APHGI|nr:protein PFC0760c-like [Aphidius gifuensis]KAF7990382.1 hypothetical protein HCN44_000187 [Aphidius gifuensis]